MSETAISLKSKAMQEEAEKNEQNFEFVCENEGFRYYKDAKTGRQCCLDSAGFWYILNEEKGAFEPMASNFVAEKQTEKPRPKQDKMQSMLKNVERFGIRFDQHGKPVFPKNEKGHFILPKDEKGSPFFPVDDRSVPIFPWDHEKGMPTFPVDDTDEPIFPRNDQNKPIVPVDEKDQPIFPVDKTGIYIFPVDESNCPIPALTVYGTRVVPKDEFGNPVIPRDRDGKALIHIASDGVTPLSMGEWKQWKKYYKEQAQVRNFYQQRQQQQQPVAVEPAAAAGVGIGAVNYSAMNSMFHPLNLEQQSAYFAADMEMLQRVRRVRPEDVDLPGQMVGQNSTTDQNAKQTANGQTSLEDREEKRKKLLKAQLKSAKMVVPPAPQILKKVAEEHKKNGTQPQKEEPKKDNGKKKQPQVAERRESSGESGKRGRGSGMSRESGKRAQRNSRKRGRERSRESSGDRGRKTMRRSTRSRSVKRRRRDSSSSSYSSTSRSRSRSSRSRSYRRSPKRSPARDSRRDRRRRSTSNSSRSSSSSSASSSSQYSSSERSHSQSRSFTSDRDEEEERIRDRIIARTLSTSVTAAPAKQPQSKDDGVAMDEAMEYGPKPPESLEVSILNSDMEMSEEEEDEKEQKQQRENELLKVNQRTSLKREPSVELLNNVPEEGGKEHEKASPPKKAETQEVVAERGIVFSALEAQPQDVVIVVEHGMASPPSKVQPQSVVASTTNTQQTEKVTTAHRQSIFNVEEALVSGDIELIKQCKEKERERYDQLKLQIAELVMKKSVHKWNWTQLREAEKRILGRHTERTLSESSEDEAK